MVTDILYLVFFILGYPSAWLTIADSVSAVWTRKWPRNEPARDPRNYLLNEILMRSMKEDIRSQAMCAARNDHMVRAMQCINYAQAVYPKQRTQEFPPHTPCNLNYETVHCCASHWGQRLTGQAASIPSAAARRWRRLQQNINITPSCRLQWILGWAKYGSVKAAAAPFTILQKHGFGNQDSSFQRHFVCDFQCGKCGMPRTAESLFFTKIANRWAISAFSLFSSVKINGQMSCA